MDFGNHQRPLASIQTESPVITQRNAATPAPITSSLVNSEQKMVNGGRRTSGQAETIQAELHSKAIYYSPFTMSLIKNHQPEQDGRVEHGGEQKPPRAAARVGERGVYARAEEKQAEQESAVEVDG